MPRTTRRRLDSARPGLCRAALLLALACPAALAHTPDAAASAPEAAQPVCKTPPRKPSPPGVVNPPPRVVPTLCPDVVVQPGPVLVINEAPTSEPQRAAPPEVLVAREALRAQAVRLGGLTAAALGALSLLLVIGGLLFGARSSISFEGNAGGFGGRAWGWRLSPPLAMLIGGGGALLLAVVIVAQLMQLGLSPSAESPAPAKRAASAPST